MSRKLSEVTSALFDSQDVDAKELDDVLNDEQSAQTWHRYSVARAALKNELGASVDLDISQRVSAAIESEGSNVIKPGFGQSKSQHKAASKWFQPLAKVAVAASVAVVAVMTVQVYQQPVGADGASAEPALLTNPIGGREPVSLNHVEPMSQVSDQQRRRQVQSYLIDHQQQLMLQQKESDDKEEQELNKGN